MSMVEKNLYKALNELHLNADLIEKEMMTYLLRIETEITKTISSYTETAETLKKCKLTKIGISKQSKISRQTFDNHNILNTYISKRIHDFELVSLPKIIARKNAEIKDLKDEIQKMQDRDVTIELLKIQIGDLKNTIKKKDNIISKKNDKIHELRNGVTVNTGGSKVHSLR